MANAAVRDGPRAAYALTQRYEQTFSAVLAGRASERATGEQRVDATGAGGSADLVWSTRVVRTAVTVAARHVASELIETEFAADGRPSTPRAMAGDARRRALRRDGEPAHEEQDVGLTPLRTIGLPRTTRVGVRVTFR